MRRSPLKRKTPLRAKKGLKRSGKLRKKSKSETALIKEDIQAYLREIVILRDGGCILRHYPETGACGGYRKDGELILQAEHLHTRSNSASFADPRLAVCLCKRHHLYYKPQHPDEYYRIVKKHIGKERTELLERVQEDRSPHKMDWKLEKAGLQQELQALKQKKNAE